ncbi:alpha/beta hydrolase [Neorhizobium sp. P12A]|uniref:alpha/beta hydrolase n=1 Tax=Neorhizobium sp. P12A TaxID=2268027 RepID=UPI00165D62E0|nr:alpha/beta hydrolase [Neorhizobium sp. P12A]
MKSRPNCLISPGGSHAVLDPAIRDFLDTRAAAGKPSIYGLSPPEMKPAFEELQSNGHSALGIDVTFHQVRTEDGTVLDFHLVRPPGLKSSPPVILYFHGGGFVAGSWSTHSRLVAALATRAQAAVAFLDYDLIGDTHYPEPENQGFRLASLISSRGGEFGLDGTRLAVAGDGAGACIATGVAWRALQERGPQLLFQALFCPWVGFGRSNCDDADIAWLSGPVYRRLCARHFGVAIDQHGIFPDNVSYTRLEAMPPALIITADYDVTRPGAEMYALKLLQAGVDVAAVRYVGTIHDFAVLAPLSSTAAAACAVNQSGELLHKALAEKGRN